MSMFENNQYQWRETYFVLFDSARKPSLKQVEKAIRALGGRFTLSNLTADEAGRLESMTVLSPDDFAALDVCYLDGEEVREQSAALTEEMEISGCQADDRAILERIRSADGRFDVLHFEQSSGADSGEEGDEMLDPSALLVVLDALTQLTGGIAIDPQGGTMA
jgi:hypothetical protein